MAKYVPSPRDWVREQVDLYESSGGTEGITLRDTGMPVIIVTHTGNKTGAVRKTPLMRVGDGDSYVLVGSQGGAPTHPDWVHNLRVNSDVEIRDETVVRPMRVHEVKDEAERSRLWQLAVAAYPLKSASLGGFRYLLQSRTSEGLGCSCSVHHVICPASHESVWANARGSAFVTIAAHRAAHLTIIP